MKTSCAVLVFFVLSFSQAIFTEQQSRPDLILMGGKIVLEESSRPFRGGIAIRNGKITAIDKDSLVQKLAGPHTEVVLLHGGTVVAGLHDAHVHFESGSKLITERVSLRYMNLAQIQSRISEISRNSSEGALIRAYHFNQVYFPGKKWPTRQDLDRVAPRNPVIISRVDGHTVWVNSLALQKAGIDKNSPDPPGGEIQRDAMGRPTGILKETAENLVENVTGPKMTVSKAGGGDPLAAGIRHANQLGLTSVTTSGSMALIDKLNELRKQGKLTLRFHVWLDGENLKEYLRSALRFNQGDGFVRVAFLKLFIDGTIGSATAAMFRPYLDKPGSRGILIHSVKKFNDLVSQAHRHNWPVGVHAIGNRGVHIVLNAVEKARSQFGSKNLRHRIEHSQFVRDRDLVRYKKMDVVASMQPTHCTSDLLVVEDRIGHERARQGYRWRSFLNSGAVLAFGTDWPIEPLDPRRGLYSSLARRNIETGTPGEKGWFPKESLTLPEALRAYSLGSAQAVCREKELGSIAPGKLADLTVFAGDIMKVSRRHPRGMLTLPVAMTVVNGRIVYRR